MKKNNKNNKNKINIINTRSKNKKSFNVKKPIKLNYNIKKKKKKIPKALREQVWLINIGKQYETKCLIKWCQNKMNVFDFHVGHNVPESKGGATNIDNLKPICSRCNSSMSNNYSIEEWSKIGELNKNTVRRPWWRRCFKCV